MSRCTYHYSRFRKERLKQPRIKNAHKSLIYLPGSNRSNSVPSTWDPREAMATERKVTFLKLCSTNMSSPRVTLHCCWLRLSRYRYAISKSVTCVQGVFWQKSSVATCLGLQLPWPAVLCIAEMLHWECRKIKAWHGLCIYISLCIANTFISLRHWIILLRSWRNVWWTRKTCTRRTIRQKKTFPTSCFSNDNRPGVQRCKQRSSRAIHFGKQNDTRRRSCRRIFTDLYVSLDRCQILGSLFGTSAFWSQKTAAFNCFRQNGCQETTAPLVKAMLVHRVRLSPSRVSIKFSLYHRIYTTLGCGASVTTTRYE